MGFLQPPKLQTPPIPDPIAIPETDDEAGEAIRKKLAKGGRRRTIITGDLTPGKIKKTTLLGRPGDSLVR